MAPGAATWSHVDEIKMEQAQADLTALKKQGAELQKQCFDTATTLKSINDTLRGFGAWMPQVDTSIKGMQSTLESVGQRLTLLEAERGIAMEQQTPGIELDESKMDRAPNNTNTLNIVIPAKGASRKELHFDHGDRSGTCEDSLYAGSRAGGHRSRPPKTDFPRFDGENPKWWKSVCEKYFALYSVEHDTWASFATMHFVGNAALWLQTFEAEHDVDSWEELCVAVHGKFGRDQHHKYLQALEKCKQTHSVEKYYQKFEAIRHKVLVHNKHYDEAYFVTKFVNGLK